MAVEMEVSLENVPDSKPEGKQIIRRLLKNKMAVIGLVIVVVNLVLAIFAPWIAPHDPTKMHLTQTLLPPGSPDFLLGTDVYGRDLLSRLIFGSRVSLMVGIFAIGIGGIIGTLLGLIAGFYGGIVDNIIMRIMDGLFAFPYVLLAIALMTALGPSLQNVIIAVSIINIPGFARIVRGETLVVKRAEFVEAARSIGARNGRLIFWHILPNCMAPLIVYVTMSIAGAILSEATLSFLGLGIQAPDPSWGNILKDGKDYILVSPHLVMYSGLSILLTVLGFNLFGDGLRDALDPRLKQ
jgi:peptide/nickel transport system permease protein